MHLGAEFLVVFYLFRKCFVEYVFLHKNHKVDTTKRISAFAKLGECLRHSAKGETAPADLNSEQSKAYESLQDLIPGLARQNAWFTEKNVLHMILALGQSLQEEEIINWLNNYPQLQSKKSEPRTIAVIMAGNVPAVGFHDFCSVLISGHKLLAKLSSDDDQLIPAIAHLLVAIEPGFKNHITFTTDKLSAFDAVIATGSNNSSRYFDYYFSKYPHIIRKNRNGVALLSGNESKAELSHLAEDIFMYFGLGCRNISKIYLPANYTISDLLDVLSEHVYLNENSKYFNNYEYNKAIFLVNGRPHFDAGNLLLVEDASLASPVSTLHFEYYTDPKELSKGIEAQQDEIQCVVGDSALYTGAIPFGKSQQPALTDYADGVDTLNFLLAL